jgi:hypothetical protein
VVADPADVVELTRTAGGRRRIAAAQGVPIGHRGGPRRALARLGRAIGGDGGQRAKVSWSPLSAADRGALLRDALLRDAR